MCKIFLIIILIIVIGYLYTNKQTKQTKQSENFDYDTDCKSCDNKGTFECRNCENCGVCVTETGDMYCAKGDLFGPSERTDCFKWEYGNIYPQYDTSYYDNGVELTFKDDPKHYPYNLYLNEKLNTDAYSERNVFYQNFNLYLKTTLNNR